jgi:hypothetical protein
MKPATLSLYRLTVAVLLLALLVTAFAYRQADTARRDSEQMRMLDRADAERMADENGYLRELNRRCHWRR